MTEPIYLSLAHVTDAEVEAVTRAVTSGWVTPLGPEVDAFEQELCEYVGVGHGVALSAGTSALQLALMAVGVQPGDEVVVPTLTFAATAFAVVHAGALPVFLDVEAESWNLDPALLRAFLGARAADGRLPAAVIPVDLVGRAANYDPILEACREFGVPVVADAAESLGSWYGEQRTGSLGDAAIFSFNGNKIMTTSGGGMLVSNDSRIIEKARYWSTQAREPLPWYEHTEVGFNYRMSNILAALGRAQLHRLPDMIARRRAIREQYRERLNDIAGVTVNGDPRWGASNAWLTTLQFDLEVHPEAPTRLREALAQQDIEARHIWKPMHQQPVFGTAPTYLTGVADRLFEQVLCLPSGVGLSDGHVDRVIAAVIAAL